MSATQTLAAWIAATVSSLPRLRRVYPYYPEAAAIDSLADALSAAARAADEDEAARVIVRQAEDGLLLVGVPECLAGALAEYRAERRAAAEAARQAEAAASAARQAEAAARERAERIARYTRPERVHWETRTPLAGVYEDRWSPVEVVGTQWDRYGDSLEAVTTGGHSVVLLGYRPVMPDGRVDDSAPLIPESDTSLPGEFVRRGGDIQPLLVGGWMPVEPPRRYAPADLIGAGPADSQHAVGTVEAPVIRSSVHTLEMLLPDMQRAADAQRMANGWLPGVAAIPYWEGALLTADEAAEAAAAAERAKQWAAEQAAAEAAAAAERERQAALPIWSGDGLPPVGAYVRIREAPYRLRKQAGRVVIVAGDVWWVALGKPIDYDAVYRVADTRPRRVTRHTTAVGELVPA